MMTLFFPPHLQRLYETAALVTDKTIMSEQFTLFLRNNDILATIPLIKITGTNGKGSVCSMLESCLITAGKKTGLFTSPHLICVSERIRINQQPVSLAAMEQQAEQLFAEFVALTEYHGVVYQLSFFQCLIIIALRLFKINGVEIAIIETAIGGYNDATHYLNANYSAITSIALDHVNLLGNTLEKIAADKAGIASDNSILVLSQTIANSLRAVIAKDCLPRGITIKIAEANIYDIKSDLKGTRFNFSIHDEKFALELPLLGEFQLQNFTVVAGLLECLYQHGLIKQLNALQGIKNTQWPARMEYHQGLPAVLFDVAHNLHAIEVLTATLNNLIPKKQRILLCGFSAEKDYYNCLQELAMLSDNIYFSAGFYKAIPTSVLQSVLPEVKVCFQAPAEALAYLQNHYSNQDYCIIVAGSVFLTAIARQAYLLNEY